VTTTDVAVIESDEVEVVETMTKKEAVALNKKIQSYSDKVANNAFELLSLLEQAATGNIHKALGYKSWSDWYSTNVQVQVEDKGERKMLAAMMSGKGMSQRAIAKSLGIGQATVSRDLDGEEDSDEVEETEGLDGKTYKRGKDAEVIEGEVVEEPAPVKRGALPKAFNEAVGTLRDAVVALLDLTEDDRFPKAQKQLANKLGDDIAAIGEQVLEVMDKLGLTIEEAEEEYEEAEE